MRRASDPAGWTCPSCGRRFARTNQAHECSPAMTLDEYFSTGADFERPIFDAVRSFLETLAPLVIEPVSVGILLKTAHGSFVELRPMTRWVAMSFPLARRVTGPPIARKPIVGATRTYHVVNLRGPQDLTAAVKSLLVESCAVATSGQADTAW